MQKRKFVTWMLPIAVFCMGLSAVEKPGKRKMWKDGSDNYYDNRLLVDENGDQLGIPTNPLQVDVVTGGGGDATAANQISVLNELQLKADLTETQPVSAATLPLPAGAATSAKQLSDGHNVTVDNSTGASAVNIQDGGNTITVDGTVTATPSGTQDVDVTANSIGLATSANQLADGHNVTVDNATDDAVPIEPGNGANINTRDVWITASLPAGTRSIGKLGSNSGVDIGDVTINNAGNSSAVPIRDGGNIITVDGNVTDQKTSASPNIVTQAVAVPGTAERVVASSTPITYLWVTAGRVDGVNTGNVYIGTSTVDKSTSRQDVLAPGDAWVWVSPPGVKLDIYDLWIDADTATDGITGWYLDGATTTTTTTTTTVTTTTGTTTGTPVVYEAENATVSGLVKQATYVDGKAIGSGDWIEWTISIATTGTHAFTINYSLGTGSIGFSRDMEIKINGTVEDSDYSMPRLDGMGWGDYAESTPLSVSVNSGAGSVRATTIGTGCPRLDYLKVTYTP